MTSKTFDEIWSELAKERLNALSWLIAAGSMEVKLALRVDDEGKLDRGMFHEKMGIFGAGAAHAGPFADALEAFLMKHVM